MASGPATVAPFPTRVEHSTAAVVSAYQSTFPSAPVPSDGVIRDVAKLLEASSYNLPGNTQHTLFMAALKAAVK